MGRAKNSINRVYNDITRFVERIPAGIAWDMVLTKVATLKQLNKSDAAGVLERFRQQGNVMVIDTKREGEDITFPVLRHKKFMTDGSQDLTNVVGQVEKVSTPGLRTEFGPKRFTPDDVVLKQSVLPAAARIDKSSNETLQGCDSYEDFENKVRTRSELLIAGQAVDETNMTEAQREDLRDKAMDKNIPLNLGLNHERLVVAAKAVLDVLKTRKAGATRTQLGNLCVKYHHLKGDDRAAVIGALIKYAGVVDYKSPAASDTRSATILLHAEHAKNVVCTKLPDTNASKRAEVERVITPAKPLSSEPVSRGYHLNAYRTDRPMNGTDLYRVAHQLHEHIQSVLKAPSTDAFKLSDLYEHFPEYKDFTDAEREQISKLILSFGKLHTYRGLQTDYRITYVSLETYARFRNMDDETNKSNPIVYSTDKTKSLDTPTVTNRTVDSSVNTYNQKEDFLPKDPVKPPVETVVTVPTTPAIPALDAAALQNMAAMLQQAAGLVENKQINDLLLEELAPIKLELNEKYSELNKNVENVLNSTVAIGLVIEKLNNLLK